MKNITEVTFLSRSFLKKKHMLGFGVRVHSPEEGGKFPTEHFMSRSPSLSYIKKLNGARTYSELPGLLKSDKDCATFRDSIDSNVVTRFIWSRS